MILGKTETKAQELKNLRPELAKDIESYMHSRQHNKDIGKDR